MNLVMKASCGIVGLFVFAAVFAGGKGKPDKSLASATPLAKTLAQVVNNVHGTCNVTFESFNQLNTGMSYYTAASMLGCPGRELSRVDMPGITMVMLGWDGEGTIGANMNAMFQNNQLMSKAQFGLR